ncbi:MAG: DUF559 domain-containing protein [Pseudomonadota bacterium]
MTNDLEQFFDDCHKEWSEARMDDAWTGWIDAKDMCESPIEQRMLIALLNSRAFCDGFTSPSVRTLESALGIQGVSAPSIIPQMPVGRYRIDFGVIWHLADQKVCLAVECDGHDFHEKTKEQAKRDKARDRYLIASGWPVIRFTGSEIFKNALECADEVGGILLDATMIDAGIIGPNRRGSP